jgi:hypothetical protein
MQKSNCIFWNRILKQAMFSSFYGEALDRASSCIRRDVPTREQVPVDLPLQSRPFFRFFCSAW